ncbi:MAG TPA: hypothetical protein VEZ40_03200 [Pyrinomonadaceae bacterium]|nr:hypothetical protein [Pyrinomonadaceae bacterium]
MLSRTLALLMCLATLISVVSAQDSQPQATPAAPPETATAAASPNAAPAEGQLEYKLLATKRTSTMEKEMSEAAAAGYRFVDVVSGPTSFGGDEALTIMARPVAGDHKQRYQYKLLATSKTSTMQKELQEAGDAGFEHRGESVFKKTFGAEVMVILERDMEAKPSLWEYKLLATKKTSTMQKELLEAAAAGYQFVGVSVGATFFGGSEVVTIMRRPRKE